MDMQIARVNATVERIVAQQLTKPNKLQKCTYIAKSRCNGGAAMAFEQLRRCHANFNQGPESAT